MSDTALVWFRRDLRLADNPALHAAAKAHRKLVPVYIFAPDEESPWSIGAAGRWWLHCSLQALRAALRARGSDLILRRGPTLQVLTDIIHSERISHVYWNRLYEPKLLQQESNAKTALMRMGVQSRLFDGDMLRDPWSVLNKAGRPYQVFTPYWKALSREMVPEKPLPAPRSLPPVRPGLKKGRLNELGLLPANDWYRTFEDYWQPGEEGARRRQDYFVRKQFEHYDRMRDLPAEQATSTLSPHLHFGEITVRRLVFHLLQAKSRYPFGINKQIDAYLRQLGWREFSRYLLVHFPYSGEQPLKEQYRRFPWRRNIQADLQRWQQGLTGIPIVDAGMRELWATGWMHNRVRMIAASFLTKNLRIHWLEGARWFWDTLLDADLANNTMGWQWVAGCGADAAPYFRIFNPLTQAQKFDSTGEYIHKWVPELRTQTDRSAAGYPQPMVDLKTSREQALSAYRKLVGKQE